MVYSNWRVNIQCRSHSRPEARKLDELHELYIIALLIDNPGLYLNEICEKIKSNTGVSVSGPTVCRLYFAEMGTQGKEL